MNKAEEYIAHYYEADKERADELVIEDWRQHALYAVSLAMKEMEDRFFYFFRSKCAHCKEGCCNKNSYVRACCVQNCHEFKSLLSAPGTWGEGKCEEDMKNLWLNSVQIDGYYSFDEAPAACPEGYRLPTDTEQIWLLDNTQMYFDYEKKEGVFIFLDGREIRIPAAGHRHFSNGNLLDLGAWGYVWSSTSDGLKARSINFNSRGPYLGDTNCAFGLSVRCVKEE